MTGEDLYNLLADVGMENGLMYACLRVTGAINLRTQSAILAERERIKAEQQAQIAIEAPQLARNIADIARSAILAEREECAKTCEEDRCNDRLNQAGVMFAHSIRARSQSAPQKETSFPASILSTDTLQSSNQPLESRFQTEADLLDGLFEKKL